MKWSIGVACLLCLLFPVYSQQLPGFPGNHPDAGTFSENDISPAAMLIQPASLGNITGTCIRIAGARPYAIPGLSDAVAQVIFPLNTNAGAGLHIGRSGNETFRRLSLSLAVGRQLTRRISLGVLFAAMPVNIAGNRQSSWAAGFSCIYDNKTGRAGVHYQTEYLNELPLKQTLHWLHLGLGKDWSEGLYTDLTASGCSNRKFNLAANIRYSGIPGLVTAIGWGYNPNAYCFEVGWIIGKYSIVTLTRWNPSVGWTPGISLRYAKSKKSI